MRYVCLCIWVCFWSSDVMAQARIESEYKIAVPAEEVEEIWTYLQTAFGKNASQILPEGAQTRTSVEVFHDTYFDDVDKSLLSYKAGNRFRQRYINDSLVKSLIQLKVPTQDALGVAREEYKFSPEANRDITDRTGLHPFLKHIKQKDLSDIDLVLGQFGTSARKMTESIKLIQTRKRVYVNDDRGALMTFTLDEVSSFYFPYTSFVELELELNEIRYTDAEVMEQKSLEEMNAKAKQALFDRFDNLVQDQTPKYNKMYNVLAKQPSSWVYNHLMYLILGGVGLFASVLMWKNEKRIANT